MGSRSDTAARHALITGGRGFTGAYVRSTLEEAGYTVTGTLIGSVGPSERTLDITSLDQCREAIDAIRPAVVVHLAAVSFVGHDDALEMYRVNVLGTLNLLQACADVGHSPRKILIASSANVYGNAAGVIDESVPPAPVSHYAASKVAMEHLVRTWFDRLPIVMVRPFNYTGRGQSDLFLVPKIISHFMTRKPYIELGNLDVARDFSDVRRVAQIYRALLESDVAGETVNVCSERPYTLEQIVQMAREASGHDLEVRVNPAFVRQNEVKKLVGSAAKLRSLVPDAPIIDFDSTIKWMVTAPK
ncbi:NAD-dependent epimerase/dehydratase family protein [Paraburkholderia rhizosphaerae]|uniref:Nucleoside-diphosphate-sugar epimerase n=1 Tax=Paraburkholderia rhizosphaerae TaxID=480658 RepID=A0A4V3HCH1_9BURK|nr:GDP-mannose 4,6-dehydratase [Paraburkholderia rhizosphaerae]TDY37154.1 nucleoside-diphosphate-sugar epimerase [Paraburkholderia rhizosphaerae]